MRNVKVFLRWWLKQKKLQLPEYQCRKVTTKGRRGFKFEVRVAGFEHVGVGISTKKKSAKSIAARDFCCYLVREKKMDASELQPCLVASEATAMAPAAPDTDASSTSGEAEQSQPSLATSGRNHQISPMDPFAEVSISGVCTSSKNTAAAGPSDYGPAPSSLQSQSQADDVSQWEMGDFATSLHGGWSLSNCEQRLDHFLQTNKIQKRYKFSAIEIGRSSGYVAKMRFFVRQLGRFIHAQGHGLTKKSASLYCALNMVRQLFHTKVIGASAGVTKKSSVKSFECEVNVHPELEHSMKAYLASMGISVPSPSAKPVSLIRKRKLVDFPPSPACSAGVIQWAPPLPGINPWTGMNIEGGSFAHYSLDDISAHLRQAWLLPKARDPEIRQKRDSLPVASCELEILAHISHYPVVLIKGDTGCGKTTQVCQYLLDDAISGGRGAYCNIIVTQRHSISAVSVAERIAMERKEELGESIGYCVRFKSILPRPHGSILFCTVEDLLRKLENGLRGVSHVIVDDVHERDIHTDFILTVLRDMVARYPDLRVILMSAMVDTTSFTNYFGSCPIVEVAGLLFPVDVKFLEDCLVLTRFVPTIKRKACADDEEVAADDDVTADDEEDLNVVLGREYSAQAVVQRMSKRDLSFDLIAALLCHIDKAPMKGAVLIFLPSWDWICVLQRYLLEHPVFGSQKYVVLPLHSQMALEEQYKVFDQVPEVTKIILSTNVAESSVTIDDVAFVIDSRQIKANMFTDRNNVVSYATRWASKTSLEQRRGRVGRVRPGYCFRLCPKDRFAYLDEHVTPEILWTPLQEISLAVKLLRLGNVGEFLNKAMTTPPVDAVREAVAILTGVSALDRREELTPLGRILARLPIEPVMGRALVMATVLGIGDLMCTIAAAASFPETSVFQTLVTQMPYASRPFAGGRHSDHVAVLCAFQEWEQASLNGEIAEMTFCQSKALNYMTLRTIQKAKGQLKTILRNAGFPEAALSPTVVSDQGPDSNLDLAITLLVLPLYPNICWHKNKRRMLMAESRVALIHPSSVNFYQSEPIQFPSPSFVFGENVQGRIVSLRQMSNITPLQLLLFGARMVKSANGTVSLDNWIRLKMKHETAGLVVALRSCVDALLVRCVQSPEDVLNPTESDARLITILKQLSSDAAWRHEAAATTASNLSTPGASSSAQHSTSKRPFKRARFSHAPTYGMTHMEYGSPGRGGSFGNPFHPTGGRPVPNFCGGYQHGELLPSTRGLGMLRGGGGGGGGGHIRGRGTPAPLNRRRACGGYPAQRQVSRPMQEPAPAQLGPDFTSFSGAVV